jgi:hypothetical protein
LDREHDETAQQANATGRQSVRSAWFAVIERSAIQGRCGGPGAITFDIHPVGWAS